MPKNVGVGRFIWIEFFRLRVCGNEGDIDAAIVSQPARTRIARPLFGRRVWISRLQVAHFGFVERLLLAERRGINLLRRDSLRNQEVLNDLDQEFGQSVVVLSRAALVGEPAKR